MPQLDPNTFIYQYFGIITLLLLVYTILSYVVLPALLRLMLIRNLFLSTRQGLVDMLNITSSPYQHIIGFKLRIYSNAVINNILASSTACVNNLISLIINSLRGVQSTESYKPSKTLFNLSDSVSDYLIFFLLIELEETNE